MKYIALLLGISVSFFSFGSLTMANDIYFYCGTYTSRLGHVEGQAKGIGIGTLNTQTGEIKIIGSSPDIVDSSHLCLSKDKSMLYSISETQRYKEKKDGYLTIFSVDPKTKSLTQKGTISSYGVGPAYVSLDQTGNYLLLANYVAGNVVVYPIKNNGMLDKASSNHMHKGKSINPDRQQQPHPHAIVASPDNKFVYVPDLGIDKIVAYEFDDKSGNLSPRPDLDVKTTPGGGPRHFVFHPSGKFAYVDLELTSKTVAYKYDNGKLTEIGTYSTIPDEYKKETTTAEIRVSPNGKFLYVSNRGHDSIIVYKINQDDGTLKPIQIISTEGKTPRNFNLDPSGNFLIAANQDSHSLISYRVDEKTGTLTPTGHKLKTPSPVLICFY